MSFTVRITSSEFAGEAKITQLCTIDATHYPLDINISNQLDNEDPYPSALNENIYKNSNPQGNMNIVGLDDAPQNAGFGHFHFNGSFAAYVMFTPGGAEDIFVTLGKITWSTSFGGTYPSATISPNSVTGPTGPDGSDEFPTWTEVWSNPN